jgi:hypothetical protein
LNGGWQFGIQLRGGAGYDFYADEAGYIVSLPNGSTYQVKAENFDKLVLEFGGSLVVYSSGMMRAGIGYDGRVRENYRDDVFQFFLGFQF